MIDFATLDTTFHTWVMEVCELDDGQVIFEDQSEVRPSGPYASIDYLTGLGRKGHDQFNPKPGDDGKFRTSGLREFTLSVNLYRAGAFEKANTLFSTIEEVMNLARFQDVGLAYISASPVRDLTRLSGPRLESRFQFDIRFRITDEIVSDPGYFTKVEVEDQINDSLLEIEKP